MWYRGGKAAGASPRRRRAVENPQVDYQMLGMGILGTPYLGVKLVAKSSAFGPWIPDESPRLSVYLRYPSPRPQGSAPGWTCLPLRTARTMCKRVADHPAVTGDGPILSRYVRMAHARGSAALVAGCLLSACLAETGPVNELFPEISSSARSYFCIRGAALPPTSLMGSLATTDCHEGPGEGYWEAYRIRTGDEMTVSFEIFSDFDSQLELLRVDDLDDIGGSRVRLALDDDSGTTPYNARLIHDLSPFTEYLILVSGTDDFQRGPYELRMGVSPTAPAPARLFPTRASAFSR